MATRRENLIKEFEDTKALIKTDANLSKAVKESIKNTKLYKATELPRLNNTSFVLKNVVVTTRTTVEAAISLSKQYAGKKIAVLNFASATNPGGGVKSGASAQEESLCRATTLYPCLVTSELFEGYYKPNRESKDVRHTDDVIYTPGIKVLKYDSGEFYSKLREYPTIDVITCAAPNLREHTKNQYNPDEGAPTTLTKEELYAIHVSRARHILDAAVANDVKVLVLGAFGCGAFKNDPAVVAKAYRDVLYAYSDKFDLVEFAVYCSHDMTNFSIFNRFLG